MKTDIHPDYQTTTIVCACGRETETRGTMDEYHVEICSHCHPFFTGKQKLVDTAGRVERFLSKYGEGTEAEERAEEAAARAEESEKVEFEQEEPEEAEEEGEAPPVEAEESAEGEAGEEEAAGDQPEGRTAEQPSGGQ